jgi:hypothetical protein
MKNLKDKYKEDYTIKKWITILVAVLVLVFLFFMLLMGSAKLKESTTLGSINDNITLIISFIGVIATFIVVGNFSQVSAMRDDVRDTKNSMRQENADFKHEILSQIKELQRMPKEIESLKEKNNQIDEIKSTCRQNSDDISTIKEKEDYTPRLVDLLINIATNEELVVLMRAIFPLKDSYDIHITGEEEGEIHTAIVAFCNDNLVFKDAETRVELHNIDRVSAAMYTTSLGRYIALIEKIRKNTTDNNPNFFKDQAENITPDIEGLDNEQDAQKNDSDI